jgi:rhamnose transport system ATP-binding protein
MPAPLFRFIGLTKTFAAVRALDEVSFDLLPGEVHALVGENGAGKSTLVKIASGALAPDSGTIEIRGHTCNHLTPARTRQLGITCIYQQPALFPDLSVAENIKMRLEPMHTLRRINWQIQREQARGLLQRVGTNISPDTLVRELSMPQQQLVEIACALGANASIVIMDEPTASLTQREQELLFGVVRNLRREGAGVIYVSHRLPEVFALADRITVLRDGKNVRTCSTRELDESGLIRAMVSRELSLQRSPGKTALGQILLSVRGLGCAAGGLRDITFDLRAGETLGLAGLVGAGRTELARTLFGLTPADEGEIVLCDSPTRIDSPQTAIKHSIGYVPEDRAQHGVIPEFPVAQNISLASHRKVFPRGWLRRSAELELAHSYVNGLQVKPPDPQAITSSLSGGNQQKVALARWLATRPKILILDEPTQGVDVGAKCEIHNIIRDLARQGLGVLLISSDLPELLVLSDRIGVMREGRLVALLPGHSDPQEIMGAAFGQIAATQ